MNSMILFTPAGVVPQAASLRLAQRRLKALGFDVRLDGSALAKHQRFGGDDETRLAALHRVAERRAVRRDGHPRRLRPDAPARPRFRLEARSRAASSSGTRWVGHSDVTALQLGLLAPHRHRAAGPARLRLLRLWPQRCDRRCRRRDAKAASCEAMAGRTGGRGLSHRRRPFDGLAGARHAVGRQPRGPRGLAARHAALAGEVKGGVLFLEDVNEHPYRIERTLLQLHQAGVLARQKAVLLGAFTAYRKPAPLDRGYTHQDRARAASRRVPHTPILAGLPFGHVATPRSRMPVGARVAARRAGAGRVGGLGRRRQRFQAPHRSDRHQRPELRVLSLRSSGPGTGR
jgi:muramoyltetrapeptide carboxypeptidase